MALNVIKRINIITKTNSLPTLSSLRPISDTKRQLSSNNLPDKPSVDSNQLQVFEKKLGQQMKEHVLDKKTHTGQTFTENDYRLTRFVGKRKEINPRFAIDLIAEEPPKACTDRWVSCDGGGGPLGHPKVFINLDDPGEYGTCGYCGLRFYKEGHH